MRSWTVRYTTGAHAPFARHVEPDQPVAHFIDDRGYGMVYVDFNGRRSWYMAEYIEVVSDAPAEAVPIT